MKTPFLFFMFFCGQIWSQELPLRGRLLSAFGNPIQGLTLQVSGTTFSSVSNSNGDFVLNLPAEKKQGLLLVISESITIQEIPFNMLPLDLGNWIVPQQELDWPIFSAEDMGLFEDAMESFDRQQIGSILQARKNLFLNTAAFQFSATFYRLRGLDNSNQLVYLNGILMNKATTGTPRWQQWGGLNDFINATQEIFYANATPDNGWGGFQSTTQINLQPSQLRSGTKISQAFTNSNYQSRTMASYVQHPNEKGWGYSFLFSRRVAKQGYQEGTLYDAYSSAALVEKIWNSKHTSWFTAIYTPTRRGKSAPITQEVFDLKGQKYNPYWGYQKGKLRNSRETFVTTPLFFLNHRWEPNKKTLWQFNAGFSFGHQSQSRVFYGGHERKGDFLVGGGQNPDPVYYQRLPSYALRFQDKPDYEKAYLATSQLKEKGQFPWEDLYLGNSKTDAAIYALYEDVQKEQNGTLVIHHKRNLSPSLTLYADAFMSQKHTSFFATPTDLFGATYLWNYNPYALSIEASQNDLNHPDKKIGKGGFFLYNYLLDTNQLGVSSKVKYSTKGFEMNWRLTAIHYRYQRTGIFKNGNFPILSHGKGKVVNFKHLQSAIALRYAFSGRHNLTFNNTISLKPPPLRAVYVNPRENHNRVPNLDESYNIHFDLGYQWQAPKIILDSHLYAIARKNLTKIGFYFADGIGGDNALFIQEILKGMEHQHWGLEFALTYHILTDLKLMGVAAYGQFRYANNPELFLSTTPNDEAVQAGFENGWKSMGVSQLKNYRLAGGPQQAYSIGIEYQDPSYWRWALHTNYFAKAFLSPNPLTRSANFYTDLNGIILPHFDLEQANTLLRQEEFPSYFLLNSTFGKSWLIHKRYLGVFLSVQNILNKVYKTGGYEQGRNANYNSLLEDQQRTIPLFAPKYWWGRGTTFFLQFSLRF
ncbi:MAG: TonB-dependent receptor [Flavobacteriaceae bacterium]|nr:TonB-dependent receptor [Flavobacteriaceae bacterium]